MNKQELIKSAIAIGEDILNAAKKDKNGAYWASPKVDLLNDEVPIQWKVEESIYDGVSGILLFLIELYEATEDSRYLECIESGAHWLVNYCENNSNDAYTFYTGRLGSIYCLIKVAEINHNTSLKKRAIDLIEDPSDFIKGKDPMIIHKLKYGDLLNGVAGSILGLVHIHSLTEESFLIEYIDRMLGMLLQNTYLGPEGVCWDYAHDRIHPLCGFSHGTSGVGFLFILLSNYFNNETFKSLAKAAFLYEDHYYDDERHNWPDFRKQIHTPKEFTTAKERYLEGDTDFFNSTGFMGAWCHGAPGIGFARLSAGKGEKSNVERAISYIINDNYTDTQETFTLCHGNGGNALLLIEAYRNQKQPEYLNHAMKVADNAREQFINHGFYFSGTPHLPYSERDFSLFKGESGVGHFYLQLLNADDESSASILYPLIKKTQSSSQMEYRYLQIEYSEALKLIFKNNYPETSHLLDNNGLTLPNDGFICSHSSFINYCNETMMDNGETLGSTVAFQIDCSKTEILYNQNCFQSFVENICFRGNEMIKDNLSWDLHTLAIPRNAVVKTFGEDEFILFLPVHNHVIYRKVNVLIYLIYEELKHSSITIKDLKSKLASSFEGEVKVATFIGEQIKLAIEKGVLLIKDF